MINYQEALDDLEFKAIKHENTLVDSEWDKCALEVQSDVAAIQELIDRNKSKKPEKHSYEEPNEPSYCKFTCAVCGRTLHKNHEVYCADCGNKVDWSD